MLFHSEEKFALFSSHLRGIKVHMCIGISNLASHPTPSISIYFVEFVNVECAEDTENIMLMLIAELVTNTDTTVH